MQVYNDTILYYLNTQIISVLQPTLHDMEQSLNKIAQSLGKKENISV